MKNTKDSKVELGSIYYPTVDQDGNIVPFDSLFLPYIWREIYFEGLYLDVLNQQTDMTIIDVGSQVGLTVQHFRPHAKKIYAIEPSPESFAALKKNKEFNHWDNVELFQVALSDKVGEVTLRQNAGNRTMNTIIGEEGNGKHKIRSGQYKNKLTVKTIDFETFFKENNIDKVDFVKFDCEGAEDLILRSESFKKVAPKITSIMVEFHFPDWQELVKYMIELGYQAKQYPSSAIIVLFTH
jgi:FkbM family methyltransferase